MDNHQFDKISGSSEPQKYRRKGSLIKRKLAEYIPVMIVTNVSLLLINTVDKIVAGNFVGEEAMSSISIFFPVSLLISVFSGPVASGISTSISNAMGKKDMEGLAHIKTAGLQITAFVAIAITVLQIPMVYYLIASYGLSEQISDMMWQYAIGIMICTPFGIFSTVGTYDLQIAGKMKALMVLSIIEGVSNVAFDLLFVAALDMGVAGAGYGTACSNCLRCLLTVIYLAKYTDFLKGDGTRATFSDFKNILSLGMPDAAFLLMLAFQNYFTLRIILHAFGEHGGVIYGLCAFCLSIVNVLLYGVQGGIRPLMGLYVGADDRQGIRDLMRHGFIHILIYAGAASAIMMIAPSFFYHIHGVHTIPDGGILSIRLYILAFVIRGFDFIFRLYLTNRKDIRFATALTVIGNATLPLFAFILAWSSLPSPFIFLAYLFTELIIFILSTVRYFHWMALDRKDNTDFITMYMTVKQKDAIEASRYIRSFADEHGIDSRISYRVALCMEEMVAYISNANKLVGRISEIRSSLDSMNPAVSIREDTSFDVLSNPSVDIVIRFDGTDKATFITLDDSPFIDLDRDVEKKELITENYDLIKRIADSVEYQYILNMNYTRITFS